MNIPFLGHFWSLAVEEQFYLLWPLVVYRFPARRILQIAVTAAALAIPLRSALVLLQIDPNYVYWNTFARMDALLIGAACACWLKLGRWTDALARLAKWLWCVPLLALPLLRLLLKGFRVGPPMQRFGYTAVALVYACLLLTLVLDRERRSPVQSFFASRMMRIFGRYSYGAYIWHPMVIAGIAGFEKKALHGTPPWFLNVPLLVGAALAVGVCSYFAVERPFLSLKRHFAAR